MANNLQIQKLTVGYSNDSVIKNLSFEIPPGTFLGLVGENGAGKSTLMLALSGQLKPQSGAIHFAERVIYPDPLWYKRRIGFVHEVPFLYPNLTVVEFLHFIGNIKKIDQATLNIQIDELLDLVSMTDFRHKVARDLSMGMRKKTIIASALLGAPDILFLDEALNGVDFESSYKIKSHLKSYVQNDGIIILSTHVLEVVEKLCDRFLVLKDGQIKMDLKADVFDSMGKKSLEDLLVDSI